MANSKKQNGRDRSGRDASDVRIAGIVCDPGPDAEDRLRRLAAIILRLAYNDVPASAAEPTPDGGSEEKG